MVNGWFLGKRIVFRVSTFKSELFNLPLHRTKPCSSLRLVILNLGLEVPQMLMEKTSIAKAIYQAILKIRASHNRPHEENISKTTAKSLGLTKEQVKDHLESLVETGAVYISQTAKGNDSYFILDVNKLGVCDSNEPDGRLHLLFSHSPLDQPPF